MSGFVGDSFPSILGGGIPGGQPTLLGGGSGGRGGSSGMEGGGARGTDRFILRRVYNHRVFNVSSTAITPFRRYLNAGDPAGTTNSAPSPLLGSPNQLSGNSMVSRIHAHPGGTSSTGQALYSGNPKFVYAGSDYVRFKKLNAKNKTYNDLSFGGAGGSSVLQALSRVRR